MFLLKQHLLARFAGDQDIQPLLDSFKIFNEKAEEDFYLRDYLADVGFGPRVSYLAIARLPSCLSQTQVRVFLEKSLHDSKYLNSPDYVRKGSDLLNRGRALFFEGYRDETSTVLDEMQRISNGFTEDRTTQEFGNSLKKLVNNFFFDQWVGMRFEVWVSVD